MIKLGKKHNQYAYKCGYRIQVTDDHGQPVSKRVSVYHYLGNDIDAAVFKRQTIKTAWQHLRAAGHTEWTQSALDELAATGIVKHPMLAVTTKDARHFAAILQGDRPPAAPAAPAKSIEHLRDSTDDIETTNFSLWMLSIVKQELTQRPTESAIRKAISNYAKENPLGALRMGMEFWNNFHKDLSNAPTPKSPVQLNIFNGSPKLNHERKSENIIDAESVK